MAKGTGNVQEERLFDWFIAGSDPQDMERDKNLLQAALASDAVVEIMYWLDRNRENEPKVVFKAVASDRYRHEIKHFMENHAIRYGVAIEKKLGRTICEKHMLQSTFKLEASLQIVVDPPEDDVIIHIRKMSGDTKTYAVSIATGTSDSRRYVQNVFSKCIYGLTAQS